MPLIIKVVPPNKKMCGVLDTHKQGKNINSSIEYRYSHTALNKLRHPLNFTEDDKLSDTNKLSWSKAQVIKTRFCNTIHKLLIACKVNRRNFHVAEVRYLKCRRNVETIGGHHKCQDISWV